MEKMRADTTAKDELVEIIICELAVKALGTRLNFLLCPCLSLISWRRSRWSWRAPARSITSSSRSSPSTSSTLSLMRSDSCPRCSPTHTAARCQTLLLPQCSLRAPRSSSSTTRPRMSDAGATSPARCLPGPPSPTPPRRPLPPSHAAPALWPTRRSRAPLNSTPAPSTPVSLKFYSYSGITDYSYPAFVLSVAAVRDIAGLCVLASRSEQRGHEHRAAGVCAGAAPACRRANGQGDRHARATAAREREHESDAAVSGAEAGHAAAAARGGQDADRGGPELTPRADRRPTASFRSRGESAQDTRWGGCLICS